MECENQNGEAAAVPLDLRAIHEASDGDMDFAKELLEVFIEDCRERLGHLAEGVRNADAEIVRREAHTIKGASANVGASGLRELAWAMERTDPVASADSAARLLVELHQESERVKAFIMDYLKSLSNKGA